MLFASAAFLGIGLFIILVELIRIWSHPPDEKWWLSMGMVLTLLGGVGLLGVAFVAAT